MKTSRSGCVRNTKVDIIYENEEEYLEDLKKLEAFQATLKARSPNTCEAKDLACFVALMKAGYTPHSKIYREKPATCIPESSTQLMIHILRFAVNRLMEKEIP